MTEHVEDMTFLSHNHGIKSPIELVRQQFGLNVFSSHIFFD